MYLHAETEANFFAVDLLLCGAGDLCGAIEDIKKGRNIKMILSIYEQVPRSI